MPAPGFDVSIVDDEEIPDVEGVVVHHANGRTTVLANPGEPGQVLTSGAGDPTWADLPPVDLVSLGFDPETQSEADVAHAALQAQIDAKLGPPRIVALGNLGATPTLALQAGDRNVWVTGTLTGNATLEITGLAAGVAIRLLLTQDATGGRTLSLKVGASSAPVGVAAAAGAASVVDALSPDGTDLYVRGAV